MLRVRLLALTLAAGALTVTSCGEGHKSTEQRASPSAQTSASNTRSTGSPTATLTRAQLITKADTICFGFNAKRASIKIATPQDYVRQLPKLGEYAVATAGELAKLTPPSQMTSSWKQMVSDAQQIANIDVEAGEAAKAGRLGKTQSLNAHLVQLKENMIATATHEGFKDCAQGI